MAGFRPLAVLLHRYVGLAMAAFLIVAGLTGTVIAFEPELDAWLNPRLFHRPSLQPALPLDRLVHEAQTRHDVQVSFVGLPQQPRDSLLLYVQPAHAGGPAPGFNQVFVDPGTGATLGLRQAGACCFARDRLLPFLHELHYTLALPGLWGVWLMGGVALAWTVDCFVAFWLTLPRRGAGIAKWKIAWQIKRRSGTTRLNLDLHRATGLWLWGVWLMLAVSSVALNLHEEVFEPAVAMFADISPTVYESRTAGEGAAPLGYQRILALAEAEAAARGWDAPAHSLFFDGTLDFYGINFGDFRAPGLGTRTLYLDGTSGALLDASVPGSGTLGDLILQLQYPLHSGYIAGLPGRLLIAASGLLVTLLSLTGMVIWWKKRRARRGAIPA